MPRKKAAPPTSPASTEPAKKKLINHVATVVDRSSSINSYGLTNPMIRVINQEIKSIAQGAEESGQSTYLSMYTFSDEVDAPLIFEANPSLAKPLTTMTYRPYGNTAMFDGLGTAITDLSKVSTLAGDHAFVVKVITDGEENQSRLYKQSISDMMREKTALGNWTFVFSVPKGGYKTKLNRSFGIPLGNIQEWDQTEAGLDEAGRRTDVGMKSYFATRAAGGRATSSFFETDLSQVTQKDLKKKLKDVTPLFRHFKVEKEVEIRPFVEAKTGKVYVKSSSYYELMKIEKVQDYKKILIQERKGGKLWGGPDIRTMLGMPTAGEVRVHPGNHGEYRIFVESTSTNRKLPRGTTVLVVKD